MTDPIDIVERLSGMSADHGPDGWPAVQMRDITALCDEVRRVRAALAAQAPQPVAWLVSGGRLFVDGAFTSKTEAEIAIDRRCDDSVLVPLYAAPGASPPAALAVPAGMALVPIEPTKAMREAPTKDRPGFSPNVAREVWAAMLAASQPRSLAGKRHHKGAG